MDAVTVELPTSPVVVLSRQRVRVTGRICASPNGTPASRALVVAACRSEIGLMCRGTPAAVRTLATIRVDIPPVDGIPGERPQVQPTVGPFAAASLQNAPRRDGDRHGGCFVALANEVQHPVSTQKSRRSP